MKSQAKVEVVATVHSEYCLHAVQIVRGGGALLLAGARVVG
jgi:hypothetical protein